MTAPRTTVVMKIDAPNNSASTRGKSDAWWMAFQAVKTSGAPLPRAIRVAPATSSLRPNLRDA